MTNTIWAEKYRPRTLDDYIGNEGLKSKLKIWIETQDVPHLLLHSNTPGTGKTTAAKMIANNIECDYLYINASDERNIDTVRDRIKSFVSTIGFKKWKIVVLDECLEEGTLVTILRNGEEVKVPIEKLDEHNDLVKSYNLKTDKVEWGPFYLWEIGEREIWEIELENGEIVRCTEQHKWFVENENGEVEIVQTKSLDKYKHILSPM